MTARSSCGPRRECRRLLDKGLCANDIKAVCAARLATLHAGSRLKESAFSHCNPRNLLRTVARACSRMDTLATMPTIWPHGCYEATHRRPSTTSPFSRFRGAWRCHACALRYDRDGHKAGLDRFGVVNSVDHRWQQRLEYMLEHVRCHDGVKDALGHEQWQRRCHLKHAWPSEKKSSPATVCSGLIFCTSSGWPN